MTDDDATGFVFAHRHVRLGQVGESEHQFAHPVAQFFGFLVQGIGLVANLPHLGTGLVRDLLPLGARLAQFFADPVAFRVQGVAFCDGSANCRVQF